MSGTFETGSSSRNVGVFDDTKIFFENSLTALVVDDCRLHRMLHRAHLTSLGVESREVKNGKEAVDLIRNGCYFDLILMDMDMPVMDGPEATRKLRQMGVTSVIVGISARSQEREKRAFVEAGLNDYYEKPLTRAILLPILQQIEDNNL